MPHRLDRRHRHRLIVGEVPEKNRTVDPGGAPEDQLVHPRRIGGAVPVHTLHGQARILQEGAFGVEQVEAARRHFVIEVRVHGCGIESPPSQDPVACFQPRHNPLGHVLVVQAHLVLVLSDARRHYREDAQQPRRRRRQR